MEKGRSQTSAPPSPVIQSLKVLFKGLCSRIRGVSVWMRGCPVCFSVRVPVHWLCPACWKELKSFSLSPKDMARVQNGQTHWRLWDWTGENDFFIRAVLQSLKKNTPDFVFEKISQEFLHRIISVRSLHPESVLVPAPPQRGGGRDHAFMLASSLSRLTGFPLKTPLLREAHQGGSQKQKSLRERRAIKCRVKAPVLIKHCLFVDDVLTTGATAFAAYEALNRPASFTILTLAFRPFYPERGCRI